MNTAINATINTAKRGLLLVSCLFALSASAEGDWFCSAVCSADGRFLDGAGPTKDEAKLALESACKKKKATASLSSPLKCRQRNQEELEETRAPTRLPEGAISQAQ